MDKLPGIMRAPPSPCTALAAINHVTEGDRPQLTEETVKIMMPVMNTFLRPNLSPSEPPTKISAASISKYAFNIQKMSVPSAPKSSCNDGRITLRAVLSIKAMLEASIVEVRIHRPVVEASVTTGEEEGFTKLWLVVTPCTGLAMISYGLTFIHRK